jgi:hypothetical protein
MTEMRNRLIAVLYDEGQRPASIAAQLADKIIEALKLNEESGIIVGCTHEENACNTGDPDTGP